MRSNLNADGDDSDDSDIQEIVVIQSSSGVSRSLSASSSDGHPMPAKRRKSSPQMDPLPSYTPTPLHILEQRARASTAPSYESDLYMASYSPTPIYGRAADSVEPILGLTQASEIRSCNDESSSDSSRGRHSRSYHDDYVPLLEPSPSVVGRGSGFQLDQVTNVNPRTATAPPNSTSSAPRRPTNSASALRPVSSALAKAVARRRNSQTERQKSADAMQESSISETEPVMWSPQLPSQIQPIKTEADIMKKKEEDDQSTYKSPKGVKQRIAHKPNQNIGNNKQRKPKAPLGIAKKVPSNLRIKYLDVIIDEYLNAGRTEDESYQTALKEEKSIADRSANRSIYINLVAGLKKRIREEAGVSTLPQDEDPKFVNGNKVVSHDEILTGKVVGTFSIQRKRKTSDPAELTEYELYDKLMRYLVPVEQLEAYGYPQPESDDPGLRKIPLAKDGQKQQLRQELASSYTCERCSKVYRVGEDGLPLSSTSKCIYHPGHLWNERINRALEKRYSCCKGDQSAGGCSSNPYHVHRGELEVANFRGYVTTRSKPERDPNKHGIYALDCEMCYTTYGLELTRVTVINHKSEVVYEKLVRPKNPILDYNTKFSGIREGDLDDINTRLEDVQRDLLEMFSSKSILVGHSLDSDMKALKIFHQRFVDTAQLFPHKRGLPFKRALRTLMVENLRVIIQEDVGHDSKEDASAALRLVLWKMKTDVPEKAK